MNRSKGRRRAASLKRKAQACLHNYVPKRLKGSIMEIARDQHRNTSGQATHMLKESIDDYDERLRQLTGKGLDSVDLAKPPQPIGIDVEEADQKSKDAEGPSHPEDGTKP